MLCEVVTVRDHSFLSRPLCEDSLVLDLGANLGEFSAGVIAHFGCRVAAAEPLEELIAQIPKNRLLTVLPVAVGGSNGSIAISVFPDRCASVCGPVAAQEPCTVREIPMVTLKEFRGRVHAPQVDLMKVDIEGAEIELFNGSTDGELLEIGQITVEFHDFLYRGQRKPAREVLARMESLGFRIVHFSFDNTNVLLVNPRIPLTGVQLALLRLRGLGPAMGRSALRTRKRIKRAIKRVLKATRLMRPDR
ncbi:MAG: FkbM family methyltransferase [Terracidiphilus sp.]|jgi:FkbM family methyltransferase